MLVACDRMRAWIPCLADALRQRFDVPVNVVPAPGLSAESPLASERLERSVFGAPPEGHCDWIASPAAPAAPDRGDSFEQLVVNATGHDPAALPLEVREGAVLTPLFHGSYTLEALARPLLTRDSISLGVSVTRAGVSQPLHGARLAMPDHDILPRALDALFGRTITLLRDAADHLITGKPLPEPIAAPHPGQAIQAPEYWSRRLLGAAVPKLGRKLCKPVLREEWCIGWRPLRSQASPLELELDAKTFTVLEPVDDAFYADPFLFRHDGVTALLFEDYQYGPGLGRISFVLMDDQGPCSEPTAALTRPYHLSYPFVFEHAGAVLMIPESSANGTIELYEAEQFPGRWRLRSVLIENIHAADTTLHHDERAGLWWMFTTVTEFGSSSHDTLSIFFSEHVDGPWWPHAANPVKFDSGSSRPAGPLILHEKRLFRPAQDCTHAYGEALVWCEIQELTPSRFHEEVVARQRPSGADTGLHTYGRDSAFEVVDFNRYRRPRRAFPQGRSRGA